MPPRSLDLGRVQRRAGAGRDERDHLLAADRVRPADDRRRGDARVLEQHLLDVAGEDVHPAADDEVLLPVDQPEVAVGVEAADVAGVQPALGEGRPRSVSGSFQ